jgi:hypothetical protein
MTLLATWSPMGRGVLESENLSTIDTQWPSLRVSFTSLHSNNYPSCVVITHKSSFSPVHLSRVYIPLRFMCAAARGAAVSPPKPQESGESCNPVIGAQRGKANCVSRSDRATPSGCK